MATAFIHGMILAFGLILPLGVQNVFIFSQGALQPKLSRVLPVVLVASVCDTFLILLAVLGVSVLVLTISWFKFILIIAGTLFLFYMGWVTWKSTVSNIENNDEKLEWPVKRQLIFALSVSLLNPHAILDTIGVIGTSSLSYVGGDKVSFTLACILTSWIWFVSLAIFGRLVGKADQSGKVRLMLNKISAVIMWFSAIYLLINLV